MLINILVQIKINNQNLRMKYKNNKIYNDIFYNYITYNNL